MDVGKRKLRCARIFAIAMISVCGNLLLGLQCLQKNLGLQWDVVSLLGIRLLGLAELVAGIAMLAEELGIAMGCCFTAWDQIAWICLQKLLGAAMGSHCFPSDRVQISGNCNVESELKAHLFFE